MIIKVARRTFAGAFVLLAFALLTGCAASRSEIRRGSPQMTMPSSAENASGRIAVIRTITDERHFEQAPGDPSTPSLGFEGADKASAAIKSRAIGRKRNSFGKAMGDVLLKPGKTVTGVVRKNTAAALEQAGYRVEDSAPTGSNPLIIDIHIKKFWAWFQPGFWAITLNTNISTVFDLSGAAAPTTIDVHAKESRMAATDSAWMEIIQKALTEYRSQVTAKARDFPERTNSR